MENNNNIPEHKLKIGDKAYCFSKPGSFEIVAIIIDKNGIGYSDRGANIYSEKNVLKTKQDLIDAFIKYVNEELE